MSTNVDSCQQADRPNTWRIGNGQFTYDCSMEATDPACHGSLFSEPSTTIPANLAVGAPFHLTYWSLDSGERVAAPGVRLESGSPDTLEVRDDGTCVFTQPGISAVLAVQDGRILELTHAVGTTLDYVDLATSTQGSVDTIELVVGDVITLHGFPIGANTGLAGRLEWAWSSTDPDVATVVPSTSNDVELTATAPGHTTITVTIRDRSDRLEVIVGGAT